MHSTNTVGTDEKDEAAVVLRVQGGDVNAYEELMNGHVSRLRAFVAVKAPAASLVDEVTHRTFVYAYRNIDKFKAGTRFGAWLRSIAGNIVRSETERFARTQKNRQKFAEERTVDLLQARMSEYRVDMLDHLEHCMNKLPEEARELLRLKYTLCCSTNEMAERVGRSASFVRTSLFRTRKMLRDCMERQVERGR